MTSAIASINAQVIPGSFRDPSGHVYRVGERILRTVTNSFASEFDFVESTGFMSHLVKEEMLLPFEKVEPAILGHVNEPLRYVLEVPKLPFVSYPYEWSFSALKAAALLHLDIHLLALQYGVTLSDASAYNIQFHGARPVFIDHLSFRPYRSGEMWDGHRQFCEQFLNPLLLGALWGISHNAWYRGALEGIPAEGLCRLLQWQHYFSPNIVKHVVLHAWLHRSAMKGDLNLQKKKLSADGFPLAAYQKMLQSLRKWVMQLVLAGQKKTVWQDYASSNNYSSDEADGKKLFVEEFVAKVCPKVVWDLGCNTGDYSKAALDAGADYVLGFDADEGALEGGYARSKEQNLPFQVIYFDAANPSPDQGWNQQEREGLQARGSADALLALALIHHLAIGRNIPLDQVLGWILNLAPAGIVEFVPKNDPMVQRLLSLREDIFPGYTEEAFLEFISAKAKIIKTQRSTSSGRLLVWYERL